MKDRVDMAPHVEDGLILGEQQGLRRYMRTGWRVEYLDESEIK
jgi:hypothetical protein